jgi:MFS family permease
LTTNLNHKLYTKNFVLLCIANLLMGTGFYFLIPTLPVFIVDVLDAGPGKVGYILAVYTLSALIIRPLTGYALDSIGRKWIYLLAFFTFAAMLGLYTLAYTFVWLMALRFMHGFTWGAATTSSSTIVVDVVPASRRGEGIGIYGLSFTLAMAIGPVIALNIMGQGNYDRMFLSSMAIAFAGFLLVMLVKFPNYEKPPGKAGFTLSQVIELRTLPMALIQLLFGLTYGGLMSFITLYAKAYEVGQAGVFFTVFAIGIAASRLVSGKIFDRKGPKALMMTGLLAGAGGFLLLGLANNFTGFMLAAILVGICMGVVMPTLQTMTNNVVEPQRRGAANATFITAFDIGIGGGSMLLGLLAEFTSLKSMYLVSAGILILSVSLFFMFVLAFYNKNRIIEKQAAA